MQLQGITGDSGSLKGGIKAQWEEEKRVRLEEEKRADWERTAERSYEASSLIVGAAQLVLLGIEQC